jgi:beta-lactam-binding protein with PASTA domain
MARTVPADLEDALAASPAARERFWAMPPEQKDSWVAYVERARVPGARRRRVAETVRRLGAAPPAAAVVERDGAVPVALPREDWSVWLIGLVLLAALAGFLVWLTVFRDSDSSKPSAVVVTSKSTVPKVTGIRYQAAQFQLRDAKLSSTITRKNAAKPKGIVIAQTPKEGKSVPQGTAVALVVSNGPPGVALPDVVGLAAADAVKALQARKLRPTLQQTASSQAPGTVLAQAPKAGTRAKPGTAVVLKVAKGNASVTVPDVTSRSQQDAIATLRAAGLGARVIQVPSTEAKGTVLAQSPRAGQKLARGSAVRLNVSKGAGTATTTAAGTTAPATTTSATTTSSAPKPPSSGTDYAGQQLADAVQKIADGRQQAIVAYASSAQTAGVVVSSARAGSRERLEVSAGPHPKAAADVPDVTGEDADTAQQDLRAAGFTAIEVEWPVSDAAKDGVVVYETPAASGQIPRGSAVVIYVGSATGG